MIETIMIIAGIIVWLAFGIYTTYRTLVYGFFSTKQTLRAEDLFALFICFPLFGFLSFFCALISGPKFTLGYNLKIHKNPWYNKDRSVKELLDED